MCLRSSGLAEESPPSPSLMYTLYSMREDIEATVLKKFSQRINDIIFKKEVNSWIFN